MKRHLLINWAGVNSGDDYLCELIVSQVIAMERSPDMRMLSEKPVLAVGREIKKTAWYPLFSALDSMKDFKRVCSEVRLADRILLGGGDVIRPEFVSMLPLLLAVLFNRKIVLVGVGVVAPEKLIWKIVYRVALSAVNLALVRDARSKVILNQFSRASVSLAPDLVFAVANRTLAPSGADKQRDSIVINLRSVTNRAYLDHLKIEKLDDDMLCDGLARVITESASLRVQRIILLPMVDDSILGGSYSEIESDLTILKKLSGRLPQGMSVELVSSRPRSIDELGAIYRSAKIVIAMRLHAIIPALAWGIPVVTIPYASKVNDLRERFEKIHTISIDNLLNEEIIKNVCIIEQALSSGADAADARNIGENAERALIEILAAPDMKNAKKSLNASTLQKLICCFLVMAFALKAAINRFAVRRRTVVEVI
ncbi:polysaccharide pyruvyl transferase family protein [Paraburkholderia fungorum]|jgi:polysaccharide pyruvyl transferase WcaK-like protein|uniref:Polysaccharide pyruvyl transferase family protein n=1 Tax=Paraburkholderia fungorum TaxID=134537 RepID=A0AAP5Q646_9BURK|nr:polysaccharide pyruvyl transferase family protein [Paraburkholderia fungorum]MDT8838261.1 polysaccharide pyruvyl transferase family protein [Paraburkholderia fungorum]PRZ51899.1 polysaccharide pyruvyl transferase WcaK-like protein [Paraburkholderia fungorum]